MILCRIQHHPSRRDLLPRLLDRLAPLYVEVSEHSSVPPDPWAGYRGCLSNLPDCSHVLVIQDDAIPVPNFGKVVDRIAQDVPVCLYLGAVPASTAVQAKRAFGKKLYIPLGPTTFMPLVAVLWPKKKAQEFLYWARYNKTTRADDGNAARWMRRTKQHVLVAVPSLVQHDETQPSVKGSTNSGGWCRAVLLAEDALDYEW